MCPSEKKIMVYEALIDETMASEMPIVVFDVDRGNQLLSTA